MTNSERHGDDLHAPPDPVEVRAKAIESLLVEKGLIDSSKLDDLIETIETRIGPHIGAAIVARAWVDPVFKAGLLKDADAALRNIGFAPGLGFNLVVVENSPAVHNLIVCTLCSCYPWPVLGLPPKWYRSASYRSRVVREPRAVLQEFGLEVPKSAIVRVWDSNAELRYLVLPERPTGTETLNVEELAALVTRDSMIGVGHALSAPPPVHPSKDA